MQLMLCTAARVELPDGSTHALAPLDAALLVWLAIEGPTPRTRLTGLLWPGKHGDAARNSLRQRLFRLRASLGSDLVVGTHTLALATGVVHDIADADRLLDPIDALELPEGEFTSWLQQQRAHCRQRQGRALAELIDRAEEAQDWADALTHATELLELEPLSEEAHRRVIRLRYMAGDRASALLAFDRCERVLKDEVGAQPSQQTLDLLATIEAALPAPTKRSAGTVPLGLLRPPRMVGRDAAMASLEVAWHSGRVAVLSGEAGIGKTRLLFEFSVGRPHIVATAARPGDAGVPFATLARLLRAVARLAGDAASIELPRVARREISRVLPEFDPEGPWVGARGQRSELLRALKSLLDAMPGPLTVLIDDLQFADEASLDLVEGLIDLEDDVLRVLPPRWVLATRPMDADAPLRHLLDRLTEQARVAPVPLDVLAEPALAELVDSLALEGVDGRLMAARLHRRTGGNPLFALETLKQAWAEHALQDLADGRGLPHAPSVDRIIARRTMHLSADAMALARVAAIAGVDFGIALAEHVLGMPAVLLSDALNELESAQVMRNLRFAHDLVQDVVHASVPPAIASHMHDRVACWLEANQGEPARVARHWIDAGRGSRACPWLARAADAALRALRPKEAIAFLEEKSRIDEANGDLDGAFAAQLAAAEHFVAYDNSAVSGSLKFERLEGLARGARQRAETLLARCNAHRGRADVQAAIDHGLAALALCGEVADPALTARIRGALGGVYWMADRYDLALPHVESSVRWMDANLAQGDEQRLAHGDLAVIYDNLGRLDEAVAHHRITIDLCTRSGRTADEVIAWSNFACNRLDVGDLDAADHALCAGQRLIEASQGVVARSGTLNVLRSLVLTHLGRYRDALAQTEAGILATQRQQPARTPIARLRLAVLWWHLGQWARMQQALETAGGQSCPLMVARKMHAALAWQLARQGPGAGADTGDAVRQGMAALLEACADRPDLTLPLHIDLAQSLSSVDARAELIAVRERARTCGYKGLVLATHVRAAALDDDPAAAREDALQALALHEGGCRDVMLLPGEFWLHVGRALSATGHQRAPEVVRRGAQWLQRIAHDEVPAEFRDSFLHRNSVNRELLALAA